MSTLVFYFGMARSPAAIEIITPYTRKSFYKIYYKWDKIF
jgi:hypothetical protein